MSLQPQSQESHFVSPFLEGPTASLRDQIIHDQILALKNSGAPETEVSAGLKGLEACRKFKTFADFETAIDAYDRNHDPALSKFFSNKGSSVASLATNAIRSVYNTLRTHLSLDVPYAAAPALAPIKH